MNISYLYRTLLYGVFLISFTSCFTGVEGTKRIDMGRSDRVSVALTREETFLASVTPDTLKNWRKGKAFYISDDKFSLISSPANPYITVTELQGKIAKFDSAEPQTLPDGTNQVVLSFLLLPDNIQILYSTGKEFESAISSLNSTQIPMLIDVDMVSKTKELLVGKTLYPLSSLWYDDNDMRITGEKYNPITVSDVAIGNNLFPIKVSFSTADNLSRHMYMNFGNSGFESRSFANLFSLENLRNKYKNISQDHWDLICRGQVCLGMTKEECKLSLGNPDNVAAGHDYSRTLDLWNYSDGVYLRFADGLLIDFRK